MHTAFLRRNARNLPSQLQAIAILLPNRGYATETSTSNNNSGNFPPPGFNAEQAKKPLPKDQQLQQQKKAVAAGEAVGSDANGQPSVEAVPGATAEDKTDAQKQSSLSQLALGKEKEAEARSQEKKLAEKEEAKKNLTFMQKVKREVLHYWDGTKLLATEVRISTKLAVKMAAGYELSRRENRQVGDELRCQHWQEKAS